MFQISQIKQSMLNELVVLAEQHFNSSPNYSGFNFDREVMYDTFYGIYSNDYHSTQDGIVILRYGEIIGYALWSTGYTCFGYNEVVTTGLIYCKPEARGGFLQTALCYIEAQQTKGTHVIFDADAGNEEDVRIRKLAMHLGYKEHGSQLIKEL